VKTPEKGRIEPTQTNLIQSVEFRPQAQSFQKWNVTPQGIRARQLRCPRNQHSQPEIPTKCTPFYIHWKSTNIAHEESCFFFFLWQIFTSTTDEGTNSSDMIRPFCTALGWSSDFLEFEPRKWCYWVVISSTRVHPIVFGAAQSFLDDCTCLKFFIDCSLMRFLDSSRCHSLCLSLLALRDFLDDWLARLSLFVARSCSKTAGDKISWVRFSFASCCCIEEEEIDFLFRSRAAISESLRLRSIGGYAWRDDVESDDTVARLDSLTMLSCFSNCDSRSESGTNDEVSVSWEIDALEK